MNFLYLFKLIDFDEKGELKQTDINEIGKVRANYLYLICKYNQRLLQENKEKVPDFFKTQLKEILSNAEKEETKFEEGFKKVLLSSKGVVKQAYENSSSKRDFLLRLGEKISVIDEKFATNFKKAKNCKHLEFIMSKISTDLMEKVEKNIEEGKLVDDQGKSQIYKDIISYNGLVNATERLNKTADMSKYISA